MSRAFNGSSYIDAGNVTQLVSATQFTLCFWANKTANNQGVYITKGTAGSRLVCERFTDGVWYLHVNSSVGSIADSTTGWQWYAMTFDASRPSGSRARFYRDTTLLTTWCTASAVSSDTGGVLIGRDPISGGYNNTSGVQFAHVQLYSRALDNGSGNELFNLRYEPFDRPIGIVEHWCQGPVDGIREVGSLGNYHGTWAGTPQFGTSTPPHIILPHEGPTYGSGVA